jgi:dihydroflavonol-4-reductase
MQVRYLKSLRAPTAAGENVSMLDVAKILRSSLGEKAKRVPRRQLSNWLVRVAALRRPALRPIVPQLGKIRRASNEKARRLLEWSPRSS